MYLRVPVSHGPGKTVVSRGSARVSPMSARSGAEATEWIAKGSCMRGRSRERGVMADSVYQKITRSRAVTRQRVSQARLEVSL